MKPYYGNVVKVEKSEKLITVRFAIDKFLKYKDSNSTSGYSYGTMYVDLKFFSNTFEKFEMSDIKRGTGLKLTDYELDCFTKEYDRSDPTISSMSFKVYDFEVTAKKASVPLEELPKSSLVLNKPIAQYTNDKESSEGDPSWMTE